ncbi:MAD2L1-binding protein [Archocentrus centrarchus]|uniref:MAD2L1-binding protein n=1 Tax=Archocentrus centrarchus TaxID=63155 RepID=UPI0011EA2646|nr:MAD2L1-binding protein [Archocentrus centrarchus]
MAEDSNILKLISNSEDTENVSTVKSDDLGITRRLSFSSKTDISLAEEPKMTPEVLVLQQGVSDDANSCRVSPEITEQLSPPAVNAHLKAKNAMKLKDASPKQRCVNDTDDKENAAILSEAATQNDAEEDDTSSQGGFKHFKATAGVQNDAEDRDAEMVRRAQEEGCVNVVFPGTVTQEGCCRFVSEILKCILYQRQQLPMTYDQLVYSQRKRQASVQDKDAVNRRPVLSADMDWRKCQQTLQELEEVLQQLEVLFSLSRVPRVLLLMGGSLVLPKELYEINMEALVSAGGNQCLRVSSCLRQLFRTLFVADLLSDTRPVRLMPTTVLVLAHRDCGVGWFRPKLQFKVPARVKKQIIALSSDPNICKEPRAEGSDWQEDYVWFQAPVTIKGFSN